MARLSKDKISAALAASFRYASVLAAVAAVILALGYRNQMYELRHAIYYRCVTSATANQGIRGAQIEWSRAHIKSLREFSADNGLSITGFIAADHKAIRKLEAGQRVSTPDSCAVYLHPERQPVVDLPTVSPTPAP